MVTALPNGRPLPGVGVKTTKPTLMAPGPGTGTAPRGGSRGTTTVTVPVVAYKKGGMVRKGGRK